MMASRKNGTLYTGVTSDLSWRAFEHKNGLTRGFTSRYGVRRLVWYDEHATMPDAIRREKQIKKWNRAWKIRLVTEMNPRWDDLYETLV